MVKEINLSDKLPSFSLEATMHNKCSDADLLGNWTVLFLYPKNNTSGCTKETKEFTVAYYIDPKIVEDPATKGISEITLSYTLFKVDKMYKGKKS